MDKKSLMSKMIELAEAGMDVSAMCANGDIGPYYSSLYAQLNEEMQKNHQDDPALSSLWEETQDIMGTCGFPWSSESYAATRKVLDHYRQLLTA